jgi:hypothetical protein
MSWEGSGNFSIFLAPGFLSDMFDAPSRKPELAVGGRHTASEYNQLLKIEHVNKSGSDAYPGVSRYKGRRRLTEGAWFVIFRRTPQAPKR